MAFTARVAARLEEQAIELPSWAFGNSGTRFQRVRRCRYATRPL